MAYKFCLSIHKFHNKPFTVKCLYLQMYKRESFSYLGMFSEQVCFGSCPSSSSLECALRVGFIHTHSQFMENVLSQLIQLPLVPGHLRTISDQNIICLLLPTV